MKRKIILPIIIASIVIAFYLPHILRSIKIDRDFCCSSFRGNIVEIEFNIKEYITVFLDNGNSYYLGSFFIYRNENLSIGDSIVKHKGSYNIYVYKDQKLKFVADSYDKHTCKCE